MSREERIPGFAPLFPPAGWWRIYVFHLLEGRASSESISLANAGSGLRPRDWMRFRIGGNSVLSLPVEGGASALKNRSASSWRPAREAVREARKIDSTLATVYGRTPYYPLLRDDLSLSAQVETDATARAICTRLFHRAGAVMGLDSEVLLCQVKERMTASDSLLRALCRQYAGISGDTGILDLLFRDGPDAIFALLPAF